MNKTTISYTILVPFLYLTNVYASETSTWQIQKAAISNTNPYDTLAPIPGCLMILCQTKQKNNNQYRTCANH